MNFEFYKLDLEGAYLIRNFDAGDNRGWFSKCYEKDVFREIGIDFHLNESFFSYSNKNVIRGLHFQTNNPQAKLVTVVSGKIWDVIVDLRFDSPTFKQWRAHELSAENHLSYYVPRGFAHGFACLEDKTVVLYQCDGKYDKANDGGIIFNDPDIGIQWVIDEDLAIQSLRDSKLPSLAEYCWREPSGLGGGHLH